MGCFLSCFRGGSSPSGDLRDPLVRESRLGDAFVNDEKKLDEATGKLDIEAATDHGVDDELRREANYLKSCGTISQTPPEILDSIPINSEDANECGDTPTNVQQTKDVVVVEENSSELLNSDDHDAHKQDTDEGRTLRTGSETEPSLEEVKPSWHRNVVRDQSTDSSDSPYPTPLVLRGDIQTPGTVYAAAHKEAWKPGKRARAFIYPVLRPIENKMQWMELKAAESPTVLSPNPPKRRNLSAGSGDKAHQPPTRSAFAGSSEHGHGYFPNTHNRAAQDGVMSPDEPKCQSGLEQQYGREELSTRSSGRGKRGVASLSHWLKPSSADDGGPDDGSSNFVGTEEEEETRYGANVSDVPFFPAFGLDWEGETDKPTPVLPKAWDGNGIPNTTTKYKEDQKVSWHATPFEERLLKVLSDEKPRHERRISGKLIHLEESGE